MTNPTRIHNQPAWLLHHRPFRDTSRILDVLSRDHGRLSLVARGARSGKSRLKGVLRPFLPLSLSWAGRGELGTLTGAELHDAPISLAGDALMSGYYVNELLLKLSHRHDPQPEVFLLYGRTIERLAGTTLPAPLLREFELDLLNLLGYGLDLEHDAHSGEAILPDASYEFRAAQGAVPVERRSGPMVFAGDELLATRNRDFTAPGALKAANRLLRGVIAYHLDGRELATRKVMRDLRRRPPAGGREGRDGEDSEDSRIG